MFQVIEQRMSGLCSHNLRSAIGSYPFRDTACHESGVPYLQNRMPTTRGPCGIWPDLPGICVTGDGPTGGDSCGGLYAGIFTNWSRIRDVGCPVGYYWQATSLTGPVNRCVSELPVNPKMCPATGRPVVLTSGNKHEFLIDFSGTGSARGLDFSRSYNSQSTAGAALANDGTQNLWPVGTGWRHSFERRLEFEGQNSGTWKALRPDGRYVHFHRVGSTFSTDNAEALALQFDGSGYKLRNERNEQEFYDSNGRLARIDGPDWRVDLSYDGLGRLQAVTNGHGRAVLFSYATPSEYRIGSVSLPDGGTIQFTYSAGPDHVGALTGVVQPNGHLREYVYTTASGGWVLLSEKREGGTVESTHGYVVSAIKGLSLPLVTQTIAPRTGATWDFSYPDSLQTSVLQPAATPGAPRPTASYQYQVYAGKYLITQQSDSCPSCGTSQVRNTSYVNGLPTQTTDARGTVTRLTQIAGELETVRVEASGLDTRPASARTDERKITTDWHATWRKPTQRQTWYCEATGSTAQPCTTADSTRWRLEARTTWALNARGQATATCQIDPANSTAMAYACGSSANAPAGVRQSRSTYCESTDSDFNSATCPFVGAVKTADGARTDATDSSTRQYYAADHASCASAPTTCPYRKGDLWKITNALAQVTEFLAYDGAGRVLRQKDANGVITDLAYNNRGWLTSRSVRVNADGSASAQDAVTRLEYSDNGDILRVLQPDDSGLEYCRDAARRISAVVQTTRAQPTRCAAGAPVPGAEAIVYTLDAYGNRLREEVRDGSGAIKRLLARQYNTLNQLRALVNAPHAASSNLDDPAVKKTSYTYDLNGNQDLATDPLGRVADNDHDPLNRLIQSIQDKDTAGATGEIAATVRYEYDARDNLRKVIDPKNLATEYVYDGLNNQTSLLSPDTGTTTYQYDAAGNRTRQTDARGVIANYTYDALNRLATIVYPSDTKAKVTFTYDALQADCAADEAFPKGRLTRIQDASGETRMCYDRFGNLRRKVQVTALQTLVMQYRYNAASRLVGMTYPSGLVVSYSRDANGRVSGVALSRGSFSLPLVSSVGYLPFGPVSSISFGNGQVLQKAWDQNYWPDAVQSPAIDYDFASNDVGNITQVASSIEGTQNLAYDRLDRLNEVRDANLALIESYGYDATGNRLAQTVGATTTPYTYATASHRLNQVGSASRTYDAVGNTLTGVPGYEAQAATYDARNRLTSVGPSNSAQLRNEYNGRGERVLSSQGSPAPKLPTRANDWRAAGIRATMYDESGQVAAWLRSGNPVSYEEIVWIDNIPVGRVESSTTAVTSVHAIHSDHLNSPRALVNAQTQGGQAAGTVVWRWRLNAASSTGSNAFGAQAASEDPDGNGTAVRFDLRFPGQQSDAVVGLNYNYFRDYEAGTGRYVESDPIGLRGGVSTYGYVSGAPINRIDPLGLAEEGPWHPPEGNAPGCKGDDSCDTLRQKMSILQQMLDSHIAWDAVNGPRHTQEIVDLQNALAKCQKFYRRHKCDEGLCTSTPAASATCAAIGATVIMLGRALVQIGGFCAAVVLAN